MVDGRHWDGWPEEIATWEDVVHLCLGTAAERERSKKRGSRVSVAMGVGARGSAAAAGARTVSSNTAVSSLTLDPIPLLCVAVICKSPTA